MRLKPLTTPSRARTSFPASEIRSSKQSHQATPQFASPSHTSNPITANMFRTALLRSARCAAQTSTRAAARPAVRTAIRSPFITSRVSSPATTISVVRCYASSSGLGQEEVTGRILDLLKNFDKVCWEMDDEAEEALANDGYRFRMLPRYIDAERDI